MQTHLIMVEGVPFTGKSTQAEFIAQQLALNGYPAQWVSEGAMLRRFFRHVLAVLEHTQSISTELLWEDWSTFVQAATTSPTTFVVDGALSFAAVWPLLAADLPPEVILTELKRISEACAPLHPRVIHLTGDVGGLASISYAQRGVGWQEHIVGQVEAFPYQQARHRSSVEGVTSFLQDAQEFMGVVLEDGGWQTLTLDVTATDWDMNRQTILAFLEISEMMIDRPVLSSAELQSYTGTYEADDQAGSGDRLSIQMENNTLTLHGTRTRIGSLVPVTKTRFHVTATMLDIELMIEEGLARRLVVFTPDGKAHEFRHLSNNT